MTSTRAPLLLGIDDFEFVPLRRLAFDGSPRRFLAGRGCIGVLGDLILGEQAAVGHSRSLVIQVHEADHFGLQFCRGGVQQRFQRRIEARFGSRRPGSAAIATVGEIEVAGVCGPAY